MPGLGQRLLVWLRRVEDTLVAVQMVGEVRAYAVKRGQRLQREQVAPHPL